MASQRLREYAESWLVCSPNALDWRAQYPQHWKALLAALEHTHLTLVPTPQGCRFDWDRRDLGSPEEVELWRADKLFADFLSESQDRLGVCKGCGCYFAKTAKRTEYHSEACAKKATSRQAKDKNHHDKRHLKFGRMIAIVRGLIADGYSKQELRDADFWKDQVITKGRKSGFSMRWINETVDDAKQEPVWMECGKCARYRAKIQRLVGVKG